MIDADWYTNGYRLYFECNHLTEDGLCGVYDDRPGMCRSFKCDVLDGKLSLPDFEERYGLPDGRDMDEMVEVTDAVEEAVSVLRGRAGQEAAP